MSLARATNSTGCDVRIFVRHILVRSAGGHVRPSCGVDRSTYQAMSSSSRTRRRATKALLQPGDLRGVVRHYRSEFQADAARELRFFAIQRSFEEAIAKAALAQRPDGKRFSHQRRIPRSALEESRQRLLRARSRLANATSFDALLRIVEHEIGPVHKIGKLTVYDTALRIAAWRQLEPEMVYLHAGTKTGAQALGLAYREATIPLKELPSPLRRLSPREIEDVLCIYKDVLQRRRGVSPILRCS